MEFYPFPALVRAGYGGTDIFGQAQVCAGNNAVEFTGEFIPLMPLGAPASIEWILGDRVVVSFSGNVYLSSPRLLRLVDVNPDLVQAAQATFAINVRFPAMYQLSQAAGAAHAPSPAQVLYLSTQYFTLCVKEEVDGGETLLLSAKINFLTLNELPLLVQRRVQLKRGEALLLCDVQPASDDNRIALAAYSTKLEHLA